MHRFRGDEDEVVAHEASGVCGGKERAFRTPTDQMIDPDRESSEEEEEEGESGEDGGEGEDEENEEEEEEDEEESLGPNMPMVRSYRWLDEEFYGGHDGCAPLGPPPLLGAACDLSPFSNRTHKPTRD